MHSFDEIEFIEEEYFKSKDSTYKKITGKLKGERFYCEVMSFDDVLSYVMEDGNIKYKNIRRSGLESVFHKLYNMADIMLMVLILGSIMRAPKGSMGGSAPSQIGPQQKKF